jgi:dsDNA-specific endonuclease/ATPase MutS2
MELPDRKGVLTVEAKGFRMQVAKEDVVRPRAEPRINGGRKAEAAAPTRPSASFRENSEEDPATIERCDMRGATVEEALDAASQILDRGFRARVPRLVLIHGLGRGVLRDAVRGYLSRAPYACSFRPGQPREGGDGVTVVEFDPMGFPP